MDKDSGLESIHTEISTEAFTGDRNEDEINDSFSKEATDIDSSNETTTSVKNEEIEIKIDSSNEATTGVENEEMEKKIDSSNGATTGVENEGDEIKIAGLYKVTTGVENEGDEIEIDSSNEASTVAENEKIKIKIDSSSETITNVENEEIEIKFDSSNEATTGVENEGDEIKIDSSNVATTRVDNKEDELKIVSSNVATTEVENERDEIKIDSSSETITNVENEEIETKIYSSSETITNVKNEEIEIKIDSSNGATTGVENEENERSINSSNETTAVVENEEIGIKVDSLNEATTGVENEENEKSIDSSNETIAVVENEEIGIKFDSSNEPKIGFENEGVEISIGSSEEATTGGRKEDKLNAGCSKEATSVDFVEEEPHDAMSTDCSVETTTKGFEKHEISKKEEIKPPQNFQIEHEECASNDKVDTDHDASQGVKLTEEAACKVATKSTQERRDIKSTTESHRKDTDADNKTEDSFDVNETNTCLQQDVESHVHQLDHITVKVNSESECTPEMYEHYTMDGNASENQQEIISSSEEMNENQADLSDNKQILTIDSKNTSEKEEKFQGMCISSSGFMEKIIKDQSVVSTTRVQTETTSQKYSVQRSDSQGMTVDNELNETEVSETDESNIENITEKNFTAEMSSMKHSKDICDLKGNFEDMEIIKTEANQSTGSAENEITKENIQKEKISQKISSRISNSVETLLDIDSKKIEDSSETSFTITKNSVQNETTSLFDSTEESNLQESTIEMESDEMEVEECNVKSRAMVNIQTETVFVEVGVSQAMIVDKEFDKIKFDQNKQSISKNTADKNIHTEENINTEHQEKNDQLDIATGKEFSEISGFQSSDVSDQNERSDSLSEMSSEEKSELHPSGKNSKQKASFLPSLLSSTSLSSLTSSSSTGCAFTLNKNIFSELKSKCSKENIKLSPKSTHQKDKSLSPNDTKGEHEQAHKIEESDRNIFAIFGNQLVKEKTNIGEKVECEPVCVQQTIDASQCISEKDSSKSEKKNKLVLHTTCDKTPSEIMEKESCSPCSIENTCIHEKESEGQKVQVEKNSENVSNKFKDIIIKSIQTKHTKKDSSGNIVSNELGIGSESISSLHQINIGAQKEVLEMIKNGDAEPMSSTNLGPMSSKNAEPNSSSKESEAFSSLELTVSTDKDMLDSDFKESLDTSNKREKEGLVGNSSDSVLSNEQDANKNNQTDLVIHQTLLQNVKEHENTLCGSNDDLKEKYKEKQEIHQNEFVEAENVILSDKKEVYEHLMYEEISSDEEDETSNEKVPESEIVENKEDDQFLSMDIKIKEKESAESYGNIGMSETVELKVVTGANDVSDNREVIVYNEENIQELYHKVTDSNEKIMDDEKSAADFENKVLDRNVVILSRGDEEIISTKESENELQPAPENVKFLTDDALESESQEVEKENFVLELSSVSSEEHERISLVDESESSTQEIGSKEPKESSLVDQETMYAKKDPMFEIKEVTTANKQNLIRSDNELEQEYKEHRIDTIQSANQQVIEKYDTIQTEQNFENDQNVLTSFVEVEQEESSLVVKTSCDDKNQVDEENKNYAPLEQNIPTEENNVVDDMKSEDDNHHASKDKNIINHDNIDNTVVEEEIFTEQISVESNDRTEINMSKEREHDFENSEIHSLESANDESDKQMLSIEREGETNYMEVYEDSRSPPVLIEINEEISSTNNSDRVDDQEYDSPPSLSVISAEDINVPQNSLHSDDQTDVQNLHPPSEKQNLDIVSSNDCSVSMSSRDDFVRSLELTEIAKHNTASNQVDHTFTKSINSNDKENNEIIDEKSSTFDKYIEQVETSKETNCGNDTEDVKNEAMQTTLGKPLENETETNHNVINKENGNNSDQNKSGVPSSNIGLQELKQLFQFITSASNIKNDKDDDTNKEENEIVEEEVMTCRLCDEQFETKEKLNSHIQTCHSESVEGDLENVDCDQEKDSETESNEAKNLPANCVPFLYLMQKWLSQELDIEEEVDSLYSIDERADFIRGYYQNCSYDQKMRLVSELSAIPTQLLTLSFDPSHSVSGLLPNIECEMGCCQEEDLRLKTFIDYALFPSLLVEHLEIQRNHQHGQFPLVLAEPHCHDVKVDSELQYENEADVKNDDMKNDDSYSKTEKGDENGFKEGENQVSQEFFKDKFDEGREKQDHVICDKEETIVCQPEGAHSSSDDSEDESLAVLSKKLKEKNNTQKRKMEEDIDLKTQKTRKVKSDKKEKKNDKKKLKVVKAKNKNKLTIKIVKKMKNSESEKTKPKKKQKITDKEGDEKYTDVSIVQTNASSVSEEGEKNENIQSDENTTMESVPTEKNGKEKKTRRKRKKDSDSTDDKQKKGTKKMKTTGTHITKKMQKTLEKNKIVATKTAFEGVSVKIATEISEDKNEDVQNPTQNILENVESTNTLMDRTENIHSVLNKNEDPQITVLESTNVLNSDKVGEPNTKPKDFKEFESKITNRSTTNTVNQNSKPEGQNMEFRNCNLCGMTFFKLEHYHKHVTKMHTVSTVHRCSRCGIECLGPKSLEAHENTHKFEFRFKSPLKHKCFTCNISFPTRALKEKHLQIHKV